MPMCRDCGKTFPNWAKIAGKRKNLSNRTRCLECSPFGSKQITRGPVSKNGAFCQCVECGRQYVYLRKSGGSMGRCNTCWTNEKRAKLRARLIDYMGGVCMGCGYSRCQKALEFHHVNPSDKSFSLSDHNYVPWSKARVEADKCVLLCANCHREVHAGLRNVKLQKYVDIARHTK
jgi:hypothetical protein